MAFTTNIDWTNFIKFTAEGVYVANYYEIRSMMQKRFMEIYGDDIDLSSATADGVYLETYCLILNNILQSFKQFYTQLNVDMATGTYLDNLCALTNVYRKAPTASTAVISLIYDVSATSSYETTEIELVDQAGVLWKAEGTTSDPLVFKPGEEVSLVFTCETLGPITAPKGWINQLVNKSVVFTINQEKDAAIGTNQETDAELKDRRNSILGASGNTVLEGLNGALLTLSTINDVKIYNNDTSNTIYSKDNTTILPHSVYVILKYKENIEIKDSQIGSLIYEKMTPGITTTMTSGVNGTSHNYQYKQTMLGQVVDNGIVQNVFWKEASAIAPQIKIEITPTTNFAFKNYDTPLKIIDNVVSMMNAKLISEDTNYIEIYNMVKNSDPLFRGQETFSIDNVSIGDSTKYVNEDGFYKYSSSLASVQQTDTKITIIIGN